MVAEAAIANGLALEGILIDLRGVAAVTGLLTTDLLNRQERIAPLTWFIDQDLTDEFVRVVHTIAALDLTKGFMPFAVSSIHTCDRRGRLKAATSKYQESGTLTGVFDQD